MSSPAFAPLSPSSLRRENVIATLSKCGVFSHPRGYQLALDAIAHFRAGNLPEVRLLPLTDPSPPPSLPSPQSTTRNTSSARRQRPRSSTPHQQVDHLCDRLNRVLHFEEEPVKRLKGRDQWLLPGDFAAGRQASASRLLQYFNTHVLNGQLSGTTAEGIQKVSVTWSKRLYKTAGITEMKRRAISGERLAAIQLSTKVVDVPERMYNTLAHELCHAATWIIDDCAKPPHGTTFKKWARHFQKWDNSLLITVCHDYDIRYKFNYQCVACAQNYGRHSRSIDVKKQVCGICKGALVLQKR